MLEEKGGEVLQGIGVMDDYLEKTHKTQETKANLNKWEQTQKLLHRKGNDKWSEETSNRMGE